MEQLPLYVSIVFVFTTFCTVLMLYKASGYSTRLMVIVALWLMLQSVAAWRGFYLMTDGVPPRFMLSVLPPVIFIAGLFLTKKGRSFIDGLDVRILTLLHILRIPVEVTLFWLYIHKAVPQVMTFEGRNFDIFCGITAPFIYYFGYVKNVWSKKILLVWNLICLLLLINIVVTAVLSAPFSFQQFGFDQPNVVLFYFPFIWLPCCVVPIVLLAHLVSLRRLVQR